LDALPSGSEEVKADSQTYVKIGDTCYLLVRADRKYIYKNVLVKLKK
jgi:hypothetical protein